MKLRYLLKITNTVMCLCKMCFHLLLGDKITNNCGFVCFCWRKTETERIGRTDHL